MEAPTKDQITAAIGIIAAVGDAIKTLGTVPSGELYAHVMGHLDMDQYQRVIDALVRAKLVRRDGNHLLTWVGDRG